MPEAVDPRTVHLLIGGDGRVRFGVPLERIGRVLEHAQLPTRYRSVNVPRLVGAAQQAPETDRYAEVLDAGPEAHVRLGPSATVREVAADHIEAVPRILEQSASRWGWSSLLSAEQGSGLGLGYVVVLDPARLSAIGAPLTREAAP